MALGNLLKMSSPRCQTIRVSLLASVVQLPVEISMSLVPQATEGCGTPFAVQMEVGKISEMSRLRCLTTTQVLSAITSVAQLLIMVISMSLLLRMSTMPLIQGNYGTPFALQMAVGNLSLGMWRLRCPITRQALLKLLALLAVSILLSRRAFPNNTSGFCGGWRAGTTHLYYDF